MVQQSLQCPAVETVLMLVLYHQYNGPILLMWERRTERSWGTIPDILWGCEGNPGEALERSIIPSPT